MFLKDVLAEGLDNVLFEAVNKEFAILESFYEQLKEYDTSNRDLLDVSEEMAQVEHQFASARKALSIVNSMKPGPYKVKHARKVMSLMNKIRARLKRLENEMQGIFNQFQPS